MRAGALGAIAARGAGGELPGDVTSLGRLADDDVIAACRILSQCTRADRVGCGSRCSCPERRGAYEFVPGNTRLHIAVVDRHRYGRASLEPSAVVHRPIGTNFTLERRVRFAFAARTGT